MGITFWACLAALLVVYPLCGWLLWDAIKNAPVMPDDWHGN